MPPAIAAIGAIGAKTIAGVTVKTLAGGALKAGVSAAAGELAGQALGGARRAGRAQGRAIGTQEDILRDQYEFYRQNYRPLEEQVIGEARGGVDPGFMAERAGQDVRQMFETGQAAYGRDLSRLGVDPSAGRYTAQLADMRIAQAAAEAGARTRARAGTIKENIARRHDVAALGRGIPMQTAAGMAGVGAQYGQAAAAYGRDVSGMGALALGAPQLLGDFASQFRRPAVPGGGGDVGTPIPTNTRVGTLSSLPVPAFSSRYLQDSTPSAIPSGYGVGPLRLGG